MDVSNQIHYYKVLPWHRLRLAHSHKHHKPNDGGKIARCFSSQTHSIAKFSPMVGQDLHGVDPPISGAEITIGSSEYS